MRGLLIFLLFTLVFTFSVHTFTSVNQDIGRHLRLGEIIWQTGEIPKTNLFSYTNPDFPFVNHHWLGEVFLYLGFLAVGFKGLIILKAFLITAAFGLAFFACPIRDREGPQRFFVSNGVFMPAIIAGLISIFILTERTDIRPEIFSFLFLGWYLFVLFKQQDEFSIFNFQNICFGRYPWFSLFGSTPISIFFSGHWFFFCFLRVSGLKKENFHLVCCCPVWLLV